MGENILKNARRMCSYGERTYIISNTIKVISKFIDASSEVDSFVLFIERKTNLLYIFLNLKTTFNENQYDRH